MIILLTQMKGEPMSEGPTTLEPPTSGTAPKFPRIGVTDRTLRL
jgi:hypothetical protein